MMRLGVGCLEMVVWFLYRLNCFSYVVIGMVMLWVLLGNWLIVVVYVDVTVCLRVLCMQLAIRLGNGPSGRVSRLPSIWCRLKCGLILVVESLKLNVLTVRLLSVKANLFYVVLCSYNLISV